MWFNTFILENFLLRFFEQKKLNNWKDFILSIQIYPIFIKFLNIIKLCHRNNSGFRKKFTKQYSNDNISLHGTRGGTHHYICNASHLLLRWVTVLTHT